MPFRSNEGEEEDEGDEEHEGSSASVKLELSKVLNFSFTIKYNIHKNTYNLPCSILFWNDRTLYLLHFYFYEWIGCFYD